MSTSESGATIVPETHTNKDPADTCVAPDGRKRAHSWKWVWEGTKMTDKVFCSACGQIRKNIHGKPFMADGEQQ